MCNPDLVNRQLTVFLDTKNPPTIAQSLLIHSDHQYKVKLDVATEYYWFVRAENGLFSVNSPIHHFVTREFTCENTGTRVKQTVS